MITCCRGYIPLNLFLSISFLWNYQCNSSILLLPLMIFLSAGSCVVLDIVIFTIFTDTVVIIIHNFLSWLLLLVVNFHHAIMLNIIFTVSFIRIFVVHCSVIKFWYDLIFLFFEAMGALNYFRFFFELIFYYSYFLCIFYLRLIPSF